MPFPIPPFPYGVFRTARAFIAFPDVASCFAPIPDGTVPEELAGVWPVFHSSQPSLNSGFVGCLAGIACLAKVSTYEGLVDWMWDGPRLWFNIWTMSIFLRLACFSFRLTHPLYLY